MISEFMFSNEQLKAIGCLAFESTMLEFCIEAIVEDVCDKRVAELLLDGKMFAMKLRIMRTLVLPVIPDKEQADAFEDLYSRITTDNSLRNTVIHGSWESKGKLSLQSLLADLNAGRNATVKRGNHTMKASEVMEVARRFSDHQSNLLRLWVAIQESLQDKFGKRPPDPSETESESHSQTHTEHPNQP